MNRFMHVSFAFAGVPKILDLEPVFNSFGASDWIRYSPSNWILWTSLMQHNVYWAIVPFLDVGDNLLIFPIGGQEMFGRMPPWVWAWINAKNAQQVTTKLPQNQIDWLKLLSDPGNNK